MHRFKLGSSGASGIGASSSSSDGSVMAHSTGSLGAGSGSICFANKSPVACSSFAFSTTSRQSSSLSARKRRHPVVHAGFFSHKSVTARDAHSVEDWRRHALFMTTSSNSQSKKERASVVAACVWMLLLKLRKTATSQACKYEVLHGGLKRSKT